MGKNKKHLDRPFWTMVGAAVIDHSCHAATCTVVPR